MEITVEMLCTKLTQLLTENGKKPLRMSGQTLESLADGLISLGSMGGQDLDESHLDEFSQRILPIVSNVNLNIGNDVAKAYKSLSAGKQQRGNREEQGSGHPGSELSSDGHPGSAGTNSNVHDDGSLEAIRRQLESLIEERDREKTERTISNKKTELKKYLRENNVSDANWIDGAMDLVSVNQDTDVKALGGNILKLYNTQSSLSADYTPPRAGKESTGSNGMKLDDVVTRIRRQRDILSELQ